MFRCLGLKSLLRFDCPVFPPLNLFGQRAAAARGVWKCGRVSLLTYTARVRLR